MCHLILFMPAFGLALFAFLPFGTALAVYLALNAGTAFIYYKLAKAMRARVRTGPEGMIGQAARVIEDIEREGKVRFMGELWTATARGARIPKGKVVRITGLDHLVLIVEDGGASAHISGSQDGHACHGRFTGQG